jgi:hypothetical protein
VVPLNTEVRTSEYLDSIVRGNDKESSRVQEISINYINSGETFDTKTTIVDTNFFEQIGNNLLNDSDPKTMAKCKKSSNWAKWKEAIQLEIASLTKREVFTFVMSTPPSIFLVGYKWVFVQKRNENNEVVRYKTRLIAQGFT